MSKIELIMNVSAETPTVGDPLLNDPPGSPAVDDVHLIGGDPTGDWIGYPYQLAKWNGAAWEFLPTWRQQIQTDKDQICVHERGTRQYAAGKFKPFAKDVQTGDKICHESFLRGCQGGQAREVIHKRTV